jgi:predicted alpha/beta-hydrolase family hydrolase
MPPATIPARAAAERGGTRRGAALDRVIGSKVRLAAACDEHVYHARAAGAVPLAGVPRLYLAHGASGSAASLAPHIAALRQRGVTATAVQLPRGRAERAVLTFQAAAPPSSEVAIGGHSFGGRVASLLAAEHPYGALVLLSYPLHPPGGGDRWDERTTHWPRIGCPVLLLSGDRDPFARIALLHEAVRRLPTAELVIFPGVGHGMGPVLDDALDRVAAFLRSTIGAEA